MSLRGTLLGLVGASLLFQTTAMVMVAATNESTLGTTLGGVGRPQQVVSVEPSPTPTLTLIPTPSPTTPSPSPSPSLVEAEPPSEPTTSPAPTAPVPTTTTAAAAPTSTPTTSPVPLAPLCKAIPGLDKHGKEMPGEKHGWEQTGRGCPGRVVPVQL